MLIDIHQRSINLLVSADELGTRRAEQDRKGWKPVENRPRKVTTALKALALARCWDLERKDLGLPPLVGHDLRSSAATMG